MRIAYDSSLFGSTKSKGCHPQKVNWSFMHGDVLRHIPVIYRFSQGIVFDIITILDKNKMQAFYDRYAAREYSLTPSQQRSAEQEHPFQEVEVSEVWINGKQAQEYSGSSGTYLPFGRQEDGMRRLHRQYASLLKGHDCFACQRFCVPYPTGAAPESRLFGLLLGKVQQLALATRPVERFYPLDMHLAWQQEDVQKELSFTHPVTGQAHILYFQSPQPLDVPLDERGEQRLYTLQLGYELSPPLPQGERLDFSSSMQYTPPPVDAFSPVSACSVGIIGCADGPTIVLASGDAQEEPLGQHGLPLHSCLSVPAFEQQQAAHFVLEGLLSRWLEGNEYHFTQK